MHQIVQDYYGKTLQQSSDLKTTACCDASAVPAWLKPLLARIHPEVLSRYYGCGLVCPPLLDGCRVLDLGCGSGRDVYALAQLVGAAGEVVGVDMTAEQLEVAEGHRAHHAALFGFDNVRFLQGYIERLDELGLVVTIHSSINFTIDRTIDFSRPIYIDHIACDFPDLKIVGNHGGWPWVTEMVAVAWKHKNVYIEIGAVAPKYIGMPGTGWEPLMVYGNSLLQDRVLFATDDMIPWQRAVAELQALPLKDKVKEKWLGLNAARLLELN